jgi:hypothetical protein
MKWESFLDQWLCQVWDLKALAKPSPPLRGRGQGEGAERFEHYPTPDFGRIGGVANEYCGAFLEQREDGHRHDVS